MTKLKLPLISKGPDGAAAQGKPQAIFQLVSPERQIEILHSALREESENKMRGDGGERREREIRLFFAGKRNRERESGGSSRVKDVGWVFFLWGEQIKQL